MIPLRDRNPTRSTPYVNYSLIAVNVVVWLWEYALMHAGVSWVVPGYGMVPARLINDPAGEAFTIFTSMFMHGGWEHIAGNMLFLYIFGDNVEDAVGHGRYLAFYLFGGVVAASAQVLIDPTSHIPMIGASGAIAGVLGAYLVLYPRAPVTVLNPFFPLWFVFGLFWEFPAWLVVGEWFVWNLMSGVGSLNSLGSGGVAFFAHIGGFIAGLVLIRPFMIGRRKVDSPRWRGWRPPPHGGLPGGPGGVWRDPRTPDSGHHPDPWWPPDR